MPTTVSNRQGSVTSRGPAGRRSGPGSAVLPCWGEGSVCLHPDPVTLDLAASSQHAAHLLGRQFPARLIHILNLHIRLVAVLLLEVLGEAPVLLPPAVLIIDGPRSRQRADVSCLLSTASCSQACSHVTLLPALTARLTSYPRCSTQPREETYWEPSRGRPFVLWSPAVLRTEKL